MNIKIPLKKRIIQGLAIAIFGLNGIAYLGAYATTHYKNSNSSRFSLAVSRPQNYNSPADFALEYTTQKIPITKNEWLDSWYIKSSSVSSQGVIILFHGKDSNKSSLLDAAKIFHSLNYDTMLVDFRGSGKSSGNTTTIGVEEAEDVATAVNYLKSSTLYSNSRKPIILYGISMGSAAILRAIARHEVEPNAIILELPFTSLLSAIQTRLRNNRLPPFPMAELVVFWGSIQHGFNGFKHQPVRNATRVECPTLILAAKGDRTVTIAEVKQLFQNLDVPKNLVIFPEAGHEILARNDTQLWTETIRDFLAISQ